MLKITLKGGDVREVAEHTTLDTLCRDLSMGLYRAVCAARVDGKVADLRDALTKDCAVEFLTFDDEDGKKSLLAHRFPHPGAGGGAAVPGMAPPR